MNQRLEGAVLSSQAGNYAAPHAGGIVVLSAALVGALTLTTSSGTTTTVPPGTAGTYLVPPSGGAPITGWQYANVVDQGKASLVVATPGGSI